MTIIVAKLCTRLFHAFQFINGEHKFESQKTVVLKIVILETVVLKTVVLKTVDLKTVVVKIVVLVIFLFH